MHSCELHAPSVMVQMIFMVSLARRTLYAIGCRDAERFFIERCRSFRGWCELGESYMFGTYLLHIPMFLGGDQAQILVAPVRACDWPTMFVICFGQVPAQYMFMSAAAMLC